ncbi:MAG: Gfo/Idh/MocA family oxidoreductase [Opitutales bacterium]|nr:Gfo/Idh/MocA family oxidoreductase [Opitutales bacterium]
MDHLLAYAHSEPNVEIVGVCHEDPAELKDAVAACDLTEDQVYTDWRACIDESNPDLVILCPATRDHALWVERMADCGKHVLIEKPFAANLAQADRMVECMRRAQLSLAINWPLAWYPPHVTAYRLLREGKIGELQEIHFYDGNRGPIVDRSVANGVDPGIEDKQRHWYYDADGGGSLIDYLGYGAVLATWYWDGRLPSEIMTMKGGDLRLAVDEQSVTMARYGNWISTFQTRWGTLTDPWEFQTQPKCGFVLKGTGGTIGHFDYEKHVRLANRAHPEGRLLSVDEAVYPRCNPVEYWVHCLERGQAPEGPLSIETNRIAQQIVDTAVQSAREGRALPLIG